MDTRKMRIEDFSEYYALAFTECQAYEARAVEAHAQMVFLEANVERLTTGTSAQYMVACERLEKLHEAINTELTGAADEMRTAGKTVRAFDTTLLGPKGVSARLQNCLVGEGGVVAKAADRLLGSDGVLAILGARLFGMGGLVETTQARVDGITASLEKAVHGVRSADGEKDGIVARVNQKLNGKNGAAAVFDESVRTSTNDVIKANNALVATAKEVTALLGRVKLLTGLFVITFAGGAFAGGVLIKFVGGL